MKYLIFSAVLLCLPLGVCVLLIERRLIRWILLAGVCCPIAFFDATAVNFFSHEAYRGTSRGMEVSLIYLVALILLVTLMILRGRFYLFPEWGSRLYLFYLLLCLPSLFQAENCLFSWFEIWKMLMMLLVFLAIFSYLEYSRGDITTVLFGLVVLVAANFLAVAVQHFQGSYQPRGIFPHRNSMAMFMSLPGTLFLARYFMQEGNDRARLPLVGFGLASFAVFWSLSRGAAVCYTVGAMVTVLCTVSLNFTPRKAGLLGIVVVLAAVGMLYLLPKLYSRFEQATEASWAARVRLAKAAANMIQDEPLCGVGTNNWGIKINPPYPYSELRDERPGATEDWKDGIVETIYLLVAAECGIPCLLALLIWFGYYILVCLRLLWCLRRTRYFFVPAGLLGGLLANYVQSTLEWVLKQQMNFIWLIIFFAILSYLNCHWRELVQAEREAKKEETGESVRDGDQIPQEG